MIKVEAPFTLEYLLSRYRGKRESIRDIYRQMFAEAHRLVAPRSIHQSFIATELPTFAAHLPGAETITLGLCTIGPTLEQRSSALFNEDPAAAVILDEVGTLWVNGLARELHDAIRAAAKAARQQASPSYRPGIGRWPVEFQSELLSLLPADELGIRLSHGMMIPQKSVSMIVGVGRRLEKNFLSTGSTK